MIDRKQEIQMPTKGKIKGMDVNLDDKVMFLTNHDNGFVYYYQM
jgi:hypothetical protein